jgi:hypothetical protein
MVDLAVAVDAVLARRCPAHAELERRGARPALLVQEDRIHGWPALRRRLERGHQEVHRASREPRAEVGLHGRREREARLDRPGARERRARGRGRDDADRKRCRIEAIEHVVRDVAVAEDGRAREIVVRADDAVELHRPTRIGVGLSIRIGGILEREIRAVAVVGRILDPRVRGIAVERDSQRSTAGGS